MILGYSNRQSAADDVVSDYKKIKQYAADKNLALDVIHSGIDIEILCDNILHTGDILIIPEIKILGNSLLAIKNKLAFFAENQIELISIREGYHFTIQQKYLLEGIEFALDIRKHMVSSITSESLRLKKAEGRVLGCRKGQKLRKKLDAHKNEVISMLSKGWSKSKIAEEFGLSVATVYNFIRDNKLEKDIHHVNL